MLTKGGDGPESLQMAPRALAHLLTTPGTGPGRHLLSRTVPAGNEGTRIVLLPAHLYKYRFGAHWKK